MNRVPADPALYKIDGDEPVLLGTHCESCGSVFFPRLAIGCEVCGAEAGQLRDADLAARGSLYSYATVHMNMDPRIEAPFTVGEVLLAGGPLARVTMLERTEDALTVGAEVEAVWAPCGTDASGAELVEPRFRIAGDGGAR